MSKCISCGREPLEYMTRTICIRCGAFQPLQISSKKDEISFLIDILGDINETDSQTKQHIDITCKVNNRIEQLRNIAAKKALPIHDKIILRAKEIYMLSTGQYLDLGPGILSVVEAISEVIEAQLCACPEIIYQNGEKDKNKLTKK